MRTYRVRVFIESADKGPDQHSEVHLGNVNANSPEEVLASLLKKEAIDGDKLKGSVDKPAGNPARS